MSSTCEAIRSGSWVGDAPQAYGTGPTSPPDIAGWALSYVQPLNDWWNELLGDPGEVEQAAQSWAHVSATLKGTADELERAHRSAAELEGRFARTLDLRHTDLSTAARGAAEWSEAIAAAARFAMSIVTAVRTFITDFLKQLGDFINALFGFVFELNPFEKLDKLKKLVSAAMELIYAGERLINKMFDAFVRLIDLMSKLGPVIHELLRRLREAIAKMLPYVGYVVAGPLGLIAGGIAQDALTDIGDVTRFDGDGLLKQAKADPSNEALNKSADAWTKAGNVTQLTSLADLVDVNGTTDAMGGVDSTAVDIKLVRGADGTEHWVVSLPSTQEWLDMTSKGAMNDGKNNLALMLDYSEMPTQYERMVKQAMREAGMSPGDPVVFTGFSQGGIMAANLASDPTLPYRAIGVVTNGSPVDTFHVPPHIPVVAFQHKSDVVPLTDFANGSPAPNVERVVLDNPGWDTDIFGAHNNDNYVNSIRDQADRVKGDYSFMGGKVLEHQVFVGEQR